MSKAASTIIVVLAVLGACLLGVSVGYIAPKVFEENFVPTPTITPTPSTIFVPVEVAFEELMMQDTITVHELAWMYLSAEEQGITIEGINSGVAGKKLQPFEAAVGFVQPSRYTSGCIVAAISDVFPAANGVGSLSANSCARIGIGSKVIMGGKIRNVISEDGRQISIGFSDEEMVLKVR